MWTCLNFWPMKNIFAKTISQWEFDYGLFTNLLRIIVLHDFSPSSFTYLSWQNTYRNFKLNFFLWTELQENLLPARYLISVAAPLNEKNLFDNKTFWKTVKPKLLDKTCARNRIPLIEKKIKNFFSNTVKSLQIFKKTAQLAKLRYNDVIIT